MYGETERPRHSTHSYTSYEYIKVYDDANAHHTFLVSILTFITKATALPKQ